MENYGFVRVAAASPRVKIADTKFNTHEIMRIAAAAEEQEVSLLVFPEMSVTGYTCGDLFGNEALIKSAEDCIGEIREFTRAKEVTVAVGAPVRYGCKLYNCAVVISGGVVRGIVPKIHLPSYNEFYESRWFASGADFLTGDAAGTGRFLDDGMNFVREGFGGEILYAGRRCNISPNLLFEMGECTFAVELCEDLWTPVPPSSFHAVAGAQLIINLSASNEVLMKHDYRRQLVCGQSARTVSGYVYCSAGYGESTQDLVFAGSSMICENGTVLAESERFSMDGTMTVADMDVEKLTVLRQKQSSFDCVTPQGVGASGMSRSYMRVRTAGRLSTDFGKRLLRHVDPHPFVPEGNKGETDSRCREITSIQTLGLVSRLQHVNAESAVIGISGGLDSTLALLVTVMAFDRLKWPRKRIIGVTMPGFGTTARTKGNADDLMDALGITHKEISIVPAVEQHFGDIGQDPAVHDFTYENSQARERTQLLMDIANRNGGIVIGTGDLSELALGWCTYNGDHMSMYGVNSSVPKTLVRSICRWTAENVFADEKRLAGSGRSISEILLDIIDTPISPELKPADAQGRITQLTEDLVGPYELHDFFLYHFFRFGCAPEKILFLAKKAFAGAYDDATIEKWLRKFLSRFFGQQFKRSCLPDGPKVGSVSLSPRGDWRMPSDASSALFLSGLKD